MKLKQVHPTAVNCGGCAADCSKKGVYQHCAEKHLHRYLAEFDFRYSNRIALGVDDQERAGKALKGISGKRLTYRNPDVTGAQT